jgi:hypothetical protein
MSEQTIPATAAPQREHEPTSPPNEDASESTLEELMNSHRRLQHRNVRKAAASHAGQDRENDTDSLYDGRNVDTDFGADLEPKQLFGDRTAKGRSYAHATSGLTAMRAIAAQSSSIEKNDHQCTGYLISAVSVDISDPGIFELNERKIAAPSEMVKHWCYKDKDFGKHCEKYIAEIATDISGQKLRASMEGHLEYIVNTKLCSIELAIQCLIDLTTRAARANQVASAQQETNMRGSQVILFNEAYMHCEGTSYESVFRPSCIDRSLDLSTVKSVTSVSMADLPGMGRLCFS